METCEHYGTHSEKLANLERQATCFSGLAEKVTIVEQSVKTAHKRIDDVQEQTAAIVRMGTSIELMAQQVKSMLEAISEHNDRLGKLEKAPGELLSTRWNYVLLTLLGCIVTIGIRRIITGGW
jgi:SMC interacting uncharacterized protein involved in chromosome segregation